ncbi:hypothetical protein WJX84_009748 [Apatococcus fuscideae]|uniref:Uncharacterized protein n=1 Tax=Apatococcus fuscideae TaxID=2026836 RepID=A0AAW1S1P4_9CHLO
MISLGHVPYACLLPVAGNRQTISEGHCTEPLRASTHHCFIFHADGDLAWALVVSVGVLLPICAKFEDQAAFIEREAAERELPPPQLQSRSAKRCHHPMRHSTFKFVSANVRMAVPI